MHQRLLVWLHNSILANKQSYSYLKILTLSQKLGVGVFIMLQVQVVHISLSHRPLNHEPQFKVNFSYSLELADGNQAVNSRLLKKARHQYKWLIPAHYPRSNILQNIRNLNKRVSSRKQQGVIYKNPQQRIRAKNWLQPICENYTPKMPAETSAEEVSKPSWAQKLDEQTSESERTQIQPWKQYLEKVQTDETPDFVRVHDAADNPPTPSLAA
jgi:hypothetical protein